MTTAFTIICIAVVSCSTIVLLWSVRTNFLYRWLDDKPQETDHDAQA